ncbi:MAG: hypothetical protein ACOYO1_16910 [Bacteroidales bacterium]
MNKATNIFGGLASVFITIAVILRFQQIPGANFMMLFGMGLFLPFFLVLKGLLVYNETKSVFPIIIGIFAMLFNIGIMFLIMHYPGGYLIYYFSFTALIILLFVWYLTELFTTNINRKTQLSTINLLIILCAVCFGFGNRLVGHSIKNGMIQSNTNFEFVASELFKMNKNLTERNDTINMSQLTDFHNKTQNAIDKIEETKKELAITTNGGNSYHNYSEIKTISNYDIGDMIMFDKGRADEIHSYIADYYNYCKDIFKNSNFENNIDIYIDINKIFMSDSGKMNWQYYTFYHMPVISSIANLSALQVRIRLFENLVYREFEIKQLSSN